MTAICKTIDIHGGLSHLLDYGADENKTSLKNNDLQNALDYARNPLKTILDLDDGDKSMLVTGILCAPETAEEEFSLLREKYRENNGNEFSAPFVYKDRKTGVFIPESNNMVCLYFSKEDSTAKRLKDNFTHYEADTFNIHTIDIENLTGFTYASESLEKMIADWRPGIVIFDPIQAFFPKGSSMTSRLETRKVLDRLRLFC